MTTQNRTTALELKTDILDKIDTALEGLQYSVQYRVKTVESMTEKCKRKNITEADMHDLLGTRIIGHKEDFAEIVQRLIRNFKLIHMDNFFHKDGYYTAVHLDLEFNGFIFECQIHTNNSSAMAMLFHDVIYKKGELSAEMLDELRMVVQIAEKNLPQ